VSTVAPRKRGFVRRWLKRLALAVLALLVLGLAALAVAYVRSTNACDEADRPAPSTPMQAVVYCDYGAADVLRLEQVEKPVPKDDQILVRVRAVSVNPLDWHFMRGKPYLMRMSAGLRKPAAIRLGVDFAGTVEAAGKSVTRFKPGDEVFGARNGAFAEYVTVREDGAVVAKPSNLTFEQAASVPIAAITALQSLRDRAKVGPGQKVLINGASGGVGTFAVQIARVYGAEVTGVCSGRNADMVRSLGAARVIDYTKEDFAKGDDRYDVILDNVGNRSLSEFRRVLKPEGQYILIGGGGPNDGPWIGPFDRVLYAYFLSKLVSQRLGFFLADMNQKDLAVLAGLMRDAKVTPVIDRRYAFRDLPEAIRYLEEGHARGKVVVHVE
jgi:NADPH:quinone reductase-like Zn-dependent oxidoreductase